MTEIKVIDVREDIKRFNEYDDKVKALEVYKKLKIIGIDDKEGAKLVRAARIECKGVVSVIEKDRKIVKAPVLELAKAIDDRAKEFSEIAIGVKTYLEEEEKAIADELAEIRAREEAEKEAKINARIDKINSLKPVFTGFSYNVGEAQIMMMEIKEFSDEDFNERFLLLEVEQSLILEAERFKAEQAKIEAKRLAEEKAEQEAKQAEINKQLEELAKIKADQEKAEAKLKADKEKFEAAKLAEEEKAEAIQKAKEDAEKAAAKKTKEDARLKKLLGIGLKFNGESLIYRDINFHWTDLVCMTDADFASALRAATERKLSIELEDSKKAEAEKIKAVEAAKIAERERLEEEAKLKEIEEAAAKTLAKQEALKLARLAPDKEKLQALNDSVLAIELPEMTTEEGKEAIVKVQEQFLKMAAWLTSVAEKL